MSVPKFAHVPYSFHTELKNRINNYFEKTGKSTYGNFSLFLKAVLLISAFAFLYIHLVFFTPTVFWSVVELLELSELLVRLFSSIPSFLTASGPDTTAGL